MKNVLYCDKFLYQKLYMGFPKTDERNQVIGSLLSVEEYNTFHIVNKNYINLCLNQLAGIKNINLIIIQKSWFKDRICIQICKFVNMMHPEAKLVFYMDDGIETHKYFLNKVVEEKLAFIVKNIKELSLLINNNFIVEQNEYLLPVMKKKDLKKLIKEYQNS